MKRTDKHSIFPNLVDQIDRHCIVEHQSGAYHLVKGGYIDAVLPDAVSPGKIHMSDHALLALEDHQTKSTALPMFADLLSIETAKPLAFEPFSYALDDRGLADTWNASEQEDMSWRVGFRRCWYHRGSTR